VCLCVSVSVCVCVSECVLGGGCKVFVCLGQFKAYSPCCSRFLPVTVTEGSE
jgi:hypothetical protein